MTTLLTLTFYAATWGVLVVLAAAAVFRWWGAARDRDRRFARSHPIVTAPRFTRDEPRRRGDAA